MSDTVKVVIEIPKEEYEYIKALSDVVIDPNTYSFLVKNGIPLDKIRAEIELQREEVSNKHSEDNALQAFYDGLNDGLKDARDILDNIGKAESEEK